MSSQLLKWPELTYPFEKLGGNKVKIFSPFEGSHVVTDPYTEKWDASRTYVEGRFYVWEIPLLQYINNKMRLVALLWIPYLLQLEEKLRSAQLEFYVCQKTDLGKTIMIPLRIGWHEDKNVMYDIVCKLPHFDYPTFALEASMWKKLSNAIGSLHGIHFFYFYGRKAETEATPVLAIQFHHQLLLSP